MNGRNPSENTHQAAQYQQQNIVSSQSDIVAELHLCAILLRTPLIQFLSISGLRRSSWLTNTPTSAQFFVSMITSKHVVKKNTREGCSIMLSEGRRSLLEIQQSTMKIPMGAVGFQQGAIGTQQCVVEIQQGAIGIQQSVVGILKGAIGIQQGAIKIPKGTTRIQQGAIGIQQGAIKIPKGANGIQQGAFGNS